LQRLHVEYRRRKELTHRRRQARRTSTISDAPSAFKSLFGGVLLPVRTTGRSPPLSR